MAVVKYHDTAYKQGVIQFTLSVDGEVKESGTWQTGIGITAKTYYTKYMIPGNVVYMNDVLVYGVLDFSPTVEIIKQPEIIPEAKPKTEEKKIGAIGYAGMALLAVIAFLALIFKRR